MRDILSHVSHSHSEVICDNVRVVWSGPNANFVNVTIKVPSCNAGRKSRSHLTKGQRAFTVKQVGDLSCIHCGNTWNKEEPRSQSL
ncbi:hypothetical protein DPMN_117984 [Dreissena polymorpha]|uniref:Uncharacterized protein n=1 Tax=Dreissena polymorpha TaxID=45954 RepID=A0A9D4JPU1_DREPO|nr:hypothetical protein DPMN_117984 [Dreissena polymorpha]